MTSTERFQDLPLEEVIGDRFGRYSKYIIQDRALPDARDGLKPVQRRILYAMHQDGNTHEKPFRKAAKTVGNVIGNYHPHGDSSVYEAMVRMSQDWKLRHLMIEMHGNNGSIDGDSAAAMRYTEARLSPISGEMLRDIEKETVDFVPNFDDTEPEPTVLPARFPNLLVNGSTGISAGYATDIPPHALHEVLDAVLLRLKKPNVIVDELMTVIQGPDFPTGGIIQGTDGIKTAYETGKGRFIIRAKTDIESLKGGKSQIVVTEIPYEVNKANLVKRIDELRIDRKLDGIADVRDESDRTGLRIVIELKKDIDSNGILQYLLKNTDLQVTYNFNMIAIDGRRPTLMSLPMLLDAYINHQKEIITRRSEYDIKKAKDRLHIVEGLMKALSILDDVIATIRNSKDKRDAKNNIIKRFGFSEIQAEAIVSLQLYRLTNTDITELRREEESLIKTIEELDAILKSEKRLIGVIRKELMDLRKRFSEPRRSEIVAKIEEIKVDIDILIPSEEVYVSVTKDGYIKRTSIRSYSASNGTGHDMKDSDYMLFESSMNTQHHILLFTSLGNYLYQPIYELPDIRWRDLGQHISSIIPLEPNESIIAAIGVEDFKKEAVIVTVSKNGMIKQSSLENYLVKRYNRTYRAMGIRKGDEMIDAKLAIGNEDVILFTKQAYALRFSLTELSTTGIRTAGVIGMNVKDDEEVVAMTIIQDDKASVLIATQRGAAKRVGLKEFDTAKRAQRGVHVLKELKTNPHRIVGALLATNDETIVLATENHEKFPVQAGTLRLVNRQSNGSSIVDEKEGPVIQVYKMATPTEE